MIFGNNRKQNFIARSERAVLAPNERTIRVQRRDLQKTFANLKAAGFRIIGSDALAHKSNIIQVWFW